MNKNNKKSRKRLTIEQKQEILTYINDNPTYKQRAFAIKFNLSFIILNDIYKATEKI